MDPQTQTGDRTWAKIEIMGHETYYGWTEPSPWLDSGIRGHVFPPDGGEEEEFLVKDWGENAIFGITPLTEERARTLASNEYYDEHILNLSEERALARDKVKLRQAKDIVRNAGYEVSEDDIVEELGTELKEKMATIDTLIEKTDLGDDARDILLERKASARQALQRYVPNLLHSDQSFIPEDDLPL